MAGNQSPTHDFSIYMLDGLIQDPCEEAIREEIKGKINAGKEIKRRKAHNLPGQPEIYVSFLPEQSLSPHWWADYLGVDGVPPPRTSSALAFLKGNKRWFALAFGYARYWLENDECEEDFGSLVAQNSIDPEKLKSCDVMRLDTAFQVKTQAPANSDVNLFGFDQENESWRSLSGLVKEEYAHMFRRLSGNRNSVRCSSPVEANEITELLRTLEVCHDSTPDKKSFPMPYIQHIKCPQIERELYGRLQKALRARRPNVMLTVPEIIDDGDYDFACLDVDPSIKHRDVTIDLYRENIKKHGKHFEIDGKDGAKGLLLFNESGDTPEYHPLEKCFVFDTELNQKEYLLREGKWYEMDKALERKANKYLEEHCSWEEIVDLPDCRETEPVYNRRVGEKFDYLCLDGTDIKGGIEPCDLFTTTPASADDSTPIPTLIHVKKSTYARECSHLFNQGLSSAVAILGDRDARSKMNDFIEEKSIVKLVKGKRFISQMKCSFKCRKTFTKAWRCKRNLKFKRIFRNMRMFEKQFEKINRHAELRVVYVIAIPRSKDKKLSALPFVSRVNLYRAIKSFQRLNIDVHLQFIYMEEKNK